MRWTARSLEVLAVGNAASLCEDRAGSLWVSLQMALCVNTATTRIWEEKMYRVKSFMPVAALFCLLTLSGFVPEVRGDLVQYWPFDDGATNAASDTAQNAIAGGNVGELIDFDLDNAPNDTPGDWVTTDLPPQLAHSTGALDFDPLTNGYVDGGNLAIVSDDLGGEATVSLWYKARTLPLGAALGEDGDRLFGFGGETSCCNEEFDGAGVVRLNQFGAIDVWPGGGGWRPVTLDEIEEDEWYHIALVWEGDEVTGYVNGEEGLTATSRFDYDTDLESTRTFGIGVRYNTGGNFFGRTPDGKMDDVAVWDEALTEGQIAAVMSGDFSQWLSGGMTGDYNDDDVLDAKDIDLQAAEMKKPPGQQDKDLFDHNDDNRVNEADRTLWVKQLRKTWVGDANFDDEFNSGDLVAVFAAGKYETGAMAGWAEGDWSGDMVFDSGDLVAAFADGGYEQGHAAVAAVPEPSNLALGLVGLMIFSGGLGRGRSRVQH